MTTNRSKRLAGNITETERLNAWAAIKEYREAKSARLRRQAREELEAIVMHTTDTELAERLCNILTAPLSAPAVMFRSTDLPLAANDL